MRHLLVFAAVLALCASAPTIAAAAGEPSSPLYVSPLNIYFETREVVASAITPGGAAVVFGVGRESDGYFASVRRREAIVVDDDGDGVVRLALDRAVPWKSLWAVVDLASGRFQLAAPEGYPLREVAFPADGVRPGADGRLARLVDRRGYGELLVVRPGAGAWVLHLADGGAEDADGAHDGTLTAAIDRLEPVDGVEPPPAGLATGDVVVLIDPQQMEIFAARLAR